jgi:hypothetical protein
MRLSFIFSIIIGLFFAVNAHAGEPYLDVSNSSPRWTIKITYATASQPNGELIVRPGSATGITTLDKREQVTIKNFQFTDEKTKEVLPFEDWCPQYRNTIYNWISVQVKPEVNRVSVICNGDLAKLNN